MVHQVDAGASVLARLVLALIHFILAVDTLISRNTLPGEEDMKKGVSAGNRPQDQLRVSAVRT